MSEKYSKEKQNEILLSIAENFDNTNELLKAFNMPMLDSGIYNEVLAYVSDEPIEYIGNKHQVALIYNIDLNGKFVESSNDNEYSYAVPYCHKSGKIIVDYVDGKEILDD